MATTAEITEADILDKIVALSGEYISPQTARDLLKFRFDRKTIADIRRLLQKNNRATITAEERILLQRYVRVGQFLDLLHGKARIVLHSARGQT